ncbi:hypothetical protein CVT24_011189 [Panaeolus cyanescens]|uniref:RRM domain-containing protein n=1 Tax=Panaeolus cyanescens TaxID=181874 RepID=A0A409VI52_9AGAR|nr:hypothetical protein CVT24_011189 [Panaeolus cyanescens]
MINLGSSVGNVPYNMGEEQLIEVFKTVGQVVGFRLVFDRDTGKPKGYGFCEFADHETAASAVRNLNNTDVGGRPLRIDLADSDPFLEGKTTVRGELLDGGFPGPSEPRSRGNRHRGDPDDFLAHVPPGIPVPKGVSSLDMISETLAKMPPGQLMDVLAQMKSFVINHPEQARTLLVKHPQLSYALFQALLLNRIVDSAILERMLASSRGPAGAPAPAQAPAPARPPMPPQHVPAHYPPHMPPFPPQHVSMPPPAAPTPPTSAMYPPHMAPPAVGQSYYRPPVPAPAPVPVPAVAPPAPKPAPVPAAKPVPEVSDSQRMMLMQVLSLTPEQINALGEPERATIMQLKSQFMGTLGAAGGSAS